MALVEGGARLTKRRAMTAASSEVISAMGFETVGGVLL